jgi:thiamine monophosphate synthase
MHFYTCFIFQIFILKTIDADGIHLTSGILMQLHKRPLSLTKLVSAACHNEEQLIQAKKIGVDFVTLSSVLPTKTHPEASTLGWENFSKLCKTVKLPIYALGGMRKKDLNLALSYGAQGIAAISALWDG